MSGKRIILLSDGTGNSASKVWKSNVWRVFESLDLRGSEQVAFYDDGVGTSSFKPLAILGGVFGWGLKRNVLDIYKFLRSNLRMPCFAGFSTGRPGGKNRDFHDTAPGRAARQNSEILS
jgi:uncharacterized protein (DUF2235 family)